MRNGLLIASVLLGTVITGSAQTSQKTSNPFSSATAQKIDRIGDDTRFSGGVVLVLADGAKITADAATFHASSNTVDFTGPVQLTLKAEK